MTQSSRVRSGSVTPPSTATTVYQAIHARRMNNEFTDETPTRESLQRMLDAAVWAPNHRLTNPGGSSSWNAAGEKRAEVGQLAYDQLYQRTQNEENASGSRQRVLDAPGADLRVQHTRRHRRNDPGELRGGLLRGCRTCCWPPWPKDWPATGAPATRRGIPSWPKSWAANPTG